MRNRIHPRRTPEFILPWVVLALLGTYTYAFFFQVQYAGFNFAFDTITEVYVPGDLNVGDKLVQVGPLVWEVFQGDARQAPFQSVQVGDEVPIVVERNGERVTIPWRIPGATQTELFFRVVSGWWVGYVFWLAGTMTLLFLRPKDRLWQLLITFNYLTAIWITAGFGPSHWHAWSSLVVLRVGVWLSVPVYLHLHWIFPEPLGRIPLPLLWLGYGAAMVMALIEWFQLIPASNLFYINGFLVAVLGSALLLILHFILQPTIRRTIGRLVSITAVALLIPVGTNIVIVLTDTSFTAQGASLLGLPAIPLAYLIAGYRRQLVGRGLRANRIIVFYLFFLSLSTLAVIVSVLGVTLIDVPGQTVLVSILVAVLVGSTAVIGFYPFQRFVERRFLGIPLPPTHLLEAYTARITTSLDALSLTRLHKQEILPSLLVRESALLRIEEDNRISPLYTIGVEDTHLPQDIDSLYLLVYKANNQFSSGQIINTFTWVRLVLPLRIRDRLIGVWLLGSRDPDDLYAQSEIPTLQRLADQTAVALTNILQAQQLRAIYQANIDRQEAEHANLARVLHDEVLNQFATLMLHVDQSSVSPNFDENYQSLVSRIRQTISGMRPAMLQYGLEVAFDAMVDEFSERADGQLEIGVDLPPSGVRYEEKVEQHLFRIIQQACENTLRHAEANTCTISGRLEPASVSLVVEDDGKGFGAGEQLELTQLLAKKHFGLVGMHERAAIIGARLRIVSTSGSGTRVLVDWQPD